MSVADEGYEDLDFEALESAVRQSPKGSWFLEEYARRLRSNETSNILDAIAKLERIITSQGPVLETPSGQASMPARQLRYFKQDEEIFEKASPAPTVAAVETVATPETTKTQTVTEQRGARLKIMRVEQPAVLSSPEPVSDAAEVPAAQAADEAKPAAASTVASQAERHRQRIIISRHAAPEGLTIPLVEDAPAATAG